MTDIKRKFAEEWIYRKVMQAAVMHKKKYPTFKVDRFLDYIANWDAKSQAWAAYQPIKTLTKRMQSYLSTVNFLEKD